MRSGISLVAVGHASSLFLAITFALYFSFDVLFPEYAMYRAWQDLLPGFEGLNWKSFVIGLVETWGYGWYFALLWVLIYNAISVRAGPK